MRHLPLLFILFVIGCEPAPKTTPQFEPPPVALPETVRELTPEEAERFIAEQAGCLIVDARTETERKDHGQILGAQPFDYLHGQPSLDRLVQVPDKSRPCLVYCAIGGRARLLAAEMVKMGFTDLRLLRGGFNAWVASGKAVSR